MPMAGWGVGNGIASAAGRKLCCGLAHQEGGWAWRAELRRLASSATPWLCDLEPPNPSFSIWAQGPAGVGPQL